MSATNRGALRADRDYYRTPDATAALCVRRTPIGVNDIVLDPCAGDGVFGDAVVAAKLTATLVEIDTEPLGKSVMRDDFLSGSARRWGHVDWVIGNPPYAGAEVFIRRAWEVAEDGVAFLLRLNFLAGIKRAEGLYREIGVPDVHVIPRRPSFTPNGKTDATDYGWFVWRKKTAATDFGPPRTPALFIVDPAE